MELEINHKSNKIIKVDIGINTDDEYFKNLSDIYLLNDKIKSKTDIKKEEKRQFNKNEILFIIDNKDKNIQKEIPIKKKKGRKSKKVKEMEQEILNEKIEKIRLFPKLNEKIFDIVKINSIEYFYDFDFNVLLNEQVELIGYKNNDKYILYSELDAKLKKMSLENIEITNIMKIFI